MSGRDHEKRQVQRNTERWLDAYMDQSAGALRGAVLTNFPNTGKSYGFHKAAAQRDEKATILQPNRALRQETGQVAAEEHGIEVEDLPSFPHESPLVDEGSPWYSETVEGWYGRGMSPRQIYSALPEEHTPPAGEDEYRRKMSGEIDQNDLLMGDPVHSFLGRAVDDRHVAMDDVDPYSSFVNEYDLEDPAVREQIMEYVDHHRSRLLRAGADIQSVDQVTNPSDREKRALHDLACDVDSAEVVPETEHVTANTSQIVRVLTEAGDDGTVKWVETSSHDRDHKTKYTGARVDDHVIVGGLPYNLRNARSLLMLTATPVLPVFEKVFEDLDVRASVNNTMTVDQRERYFDDILGADVVQTTRSSRFISGGSNVRPEKFCYTVKQIEERHGEKPIVISSKKALTGKLSEHVEELWVETINFARAIGTNEFGEESLALVWGAPHYGDDYVKRVAAFCGDRDAEPIREDGEPTRWSTETSQDIYDNMCEGTVFQAMLRVGRSTDDRSTIYVETDKIPDDVPRAQPTGRDIFRMLSDAEQQVVAAADELGAFTVREINKLVMSSRKTVYNVMHRLVDEGAAEVVGSGDYNADEFEVKLEAAAQGVVSESVKETLNNIIMQKPHTFEYRPPDVEPRERVLRTSMGAEPARIDPERPPDDQLDLGIWQST